MKTSNLVKLTNLSNTSRMSGNSLESVRELRKKEGKEAYDLWMDKIEYIDTIYGLIDLIEKVDVKDKVIVEIGSFLGVSTETFLLHEPKKMYAIDPWGLAGNSTGLAPPEREPNEADHFTEDHGGWDGVEQKFRDRVKSYQNIEIIKNFSVEAAKNFEEESLDFVYVDGNHEWEHVANDITSWWPKIKVNGYMGGHDFYETKELCHAIGVENTVYYYFAHEGHLNNHVEVFSDSSWLFKKIHK